MAGIEGSESDAVKVETHLVLETSTSTGATETRDMSQDEQLSINDSTKAIPCKEEGGTKFNLRSILNQQKTLKVYSYLNHFFFRLDIF